MDDIIYTLAEGFSANDLTAMLKGVSEHSSNDTAIRMVASALRLSWMNHNSIKKIIDKMGEEMDY